MPRNTSVLLLLTPLLLIAQPPAILQEGIRNEASGIPPSLPGGALSPGSRLILAGLRLPPQPTIQLRSGDRSWKVTPLEATAKQLVWQLPPDVPVGAASVILANADGESRPFPVTVASLSGGLYSQNGHGWGPARARRSRTDGQLEPVVNSSPAHPGEELVLEATGSSRDFVVTLGGVGVPARWVPRPEGRAEVQLIVPPGAPTGCYVPVQLRYRNGPVGNTVTLPVASSGRSVCERSKPWPESVFPENSLLGLLVLTRMNLLVSLPDQSEVQFSDEESVFHSFSPLRSAPAEILPPHGTCLTYQGIYEAAFGVRQNLLELIQAYLPGKSKRAGAEIRLHGPAGNKSIPRGPETGDYFAFLGGERPDYGRSASPLYLTRGAYSAESLGGADVGEFQVSFRVPPELRMKNITRLDKVERARGMKLEWSGGDQETPTYVVAASVRYSTGAFGACLCAVAPGQTKLALPPEMLANFPESNPEATLPLNFVLLVSAPAPTPFAASGLAAGFVLPVMVAGRSVEFH